LRSGHRERSEDEQVAPADPMLDCAILRHSELDPGFMSAEADARSPALAFMGAGLRRHDR